MFAGKISFILYRGCSILIYMPVIITEQGIAMVSEKIKHLLKFKFYMNISYKLMMHTQNLTKSISCE